MTTTKDTLGSALIAAQKSFAPIIKDNTVSTGRFSYKYADIGSVLESVTDALHDNGLVVLQPLDLVNGVPVVRTILLHAASGERIEGNALVVWADKNDPQKFGGGITYTRRYALMSMLGLNAEDDDGQHARKPAPPQETVNQRTGEIRTTSQMQQRPVTDAMADSMEDLSQAIVSDASDRDGKGTATQQQRNRFFAIAKSDELNMSDEDIKAELMSWYGTESTREISFNQMIDITRVLSERQQQARKANRNG